MYGWRELSATREDMRLAQEQLTRPFAGATYPRRRTTARWSLEEALKDPHACLMARISMQRTLLLLHSKLRRTAVGSNTHLWKWLD